MDIEIKIGREVEGSGVLKVPSSCKKVSRRHATLAWRDGVVTIEDNESSNGTYVNGKRVAKTKLKEDDTVWLGGNGNNENNECYQLDLKKIFSSCREAEKKARTDFSKEFEEVKQVYIEYQNKVAEAKKKSTVKSQLPLRLVSFLPTLIGAIIALNPKGDPTMRITVVSVGGAITGLINILMIGKGSSNDKLNEELTDLQIEYQKKYKCPKCGKEFNITTQHWKKLEAGGVCPHKCGAEFVKK